MAKTKAADTKAAKTKATGTKKAETEAATHNFSKAPAADTKTSVIANGTRAVNANGTRAKAKKAVSNAADTQTAHTQTSAARVSDTQTSDTRTTDTQDFDANLLFDKERFVGACSIVELIERESGFKQSVYVPKNSKRAVNSKNREGDTAIGGLGEGTVHFVLKNYISANRQNQEIEFKKKIIDVFLDGKAYEIQSASFGSLKSKLSTFLKEFPVTIVYPSICKKNIAWLNPETGELSDFRKSPKKGSVYSIFDELVYIKDYISHPKLSFCVFLLEANETRLLCGYSADKKKGSVKLDRVPTQLLGTQYFDGAASFARLLPDCEEFSAKMLASYAGIDVALARKTLYCLSHAGVIFNSRTLKREKYYKLNQGGLK